MFIHDQSIDADSREAVNLEFFIAWVHYAADNWRRYGIHGFSQTYIMC